MPRRPGVTGIYGFSMTVFDLFPQVSGSAGVAKTAPLRGGTLVKEGRHVCQGFLSDLILVAMGQLR